MAGRGKHFERSGTDGHGQASEFVDTPVNQPGDHGDPSAEDKKTETVDLPGVGDDRLREG